MDIRFVYITAGNRDEARAIGRSLVSARLAACANIIHPVHSIYWWEGKMQEDTEGIIVAKTREDLVDALIEKVKSMHSYECPCIVTLPILEGYRPFLDWVTQETGKPGGE
ncbi:MAG: divalent-cation tolerance protein CutA [Deltaproteobacteria bacterium]|nr:divalent-cation tolerance protein CutA [Deltaproteobacteria bacterium]